MENSLAIKNETDNYYICSTPRYLPKRNKIIDTDIWTFIAALFVIALKLEQLQGSSIREEINKLSHVYTMQYYSTIKWMFFEVVLDLL